MTKSLRKNIYSCNSKLYEILRSMNILFRKETDKTEVPHGFFYSLTNLSLTYLFNKIKNTDILRLMQPQDLIIIIVIIL